jgi:hypothetical protein
MFNTYDRIKIECGGKKIGTYTVSHTTPPTPTKITTLEIIPSCDGPSSLKIEQTEYETIWTNYDLTGLDLIGSYLRFGSTPTSDVVGPVEAVYWEEPSVTALTNDDDEDVSGSYSGRLFIKGSLPETDGYEITGVLYQYGAGQSEKSECSDRGVCETDSGLCKCFSGYTGNACETQNSLSA